MHSIKILAASLRAGCVLTAHSGPSPYASLAPQMKGFKNPTIETSIGGHAICVAGTINVEASADNIEIALEQPKDQIELTQLVLELITINSTLDKQVLGDSQQISGTYGIYSQLCFPTSASYTNTSSLQFLIHGGGFDHRYWDNALGYSYVDYAAENGYMTFAYDRLGTGLSEHPDPIQVVQTPLHVEIAHQLVQLLRSGGIGGQAFNTVIGVGHSYGSAQTLGITSNYPQDFDAVILTGASATPDGYLTNIVGQVQTIAALNDPVQFSDWQYGYALPGYIEGLQFGFFHYPGFDPLLLYLAYSLRQPQGLGELIPPLDIKPSLQFTGPIFVLDGEEDLPVCLGNCRLPQNQAASAKPLLFPNASNGSGWYLVPNTGHGVNFHYSAKDAYAKQIAFLRANGL